jgi:hypothetical protein
MKLAYASGRKTSGMPNGRKETTMNSRIVMRGMVIALLVSAVSLLLAGCPQNVRVKQWGGTMTRELPAGQKLIVATWKDGDLWYLTRPMRSDEAVETYTFKEDSTWGVLNGTVIFVERK